VAERSADDIQREIEQARAALAETVDELAYRSSPKRVTENVKQALLAKARTPQGQAVIAGVGVLVIVAVVRRFRRH
jgi:osmotically-inducible protein OsmY